MIIDGKQITTGNVGGKFQGLDLATSLFLGGHSNVVDLGFNQGFMGCISQLKVNGIEIDILPRDGIETCKSCNHFDVQCDNGGHCQEANNPGGYTCLCQSGFSGSHCQKIGVACYPGACGVGQCVSTTNGFECKCPFGLQGLLCDKAISIKEPYFEEESYLAVSKPTHILRA